MPEHTEVLRIASVMRQKLVASILQNLQKADPDWCVVGRPDLFTRKAEYIFVLTDRKSELTPESVAVGIAAEKAIESGLEVVDVLCSALQDVFERDGLMELDLQYVLGIRARIDVSNCSFGELWNVIRVYGSPEGVVIGREYPEITRLLIVMRQKALMDALRSVPTVRIESPDVSVMFDPCRSFDLSILCDDDHDAAMEVAVRDLQVKLDLCAHYAKLVRDGSVEELVAMPDAVDEILCLGRIDASDCTVEEKCRILKLYGSAEVYPE